MATSSTVTLHDECTAEPIHRAGKRYFTCPHFRTFIVQAMVPREISYSVKEMPLLRGMTDVTNKDLFG